MRKASWDYVKVSTEEQFSKEVTKEEKKKKNLLSLIKILSITSNTMTSISSLFHFYAEIYPRMDGQMKEGKPGEKAQCSLNFLPFLSDCDCFCSRRLKAAELSRLHK